ncbi:NAD(P)-dependent oxidoreductase [Mycobacterium sp. ITM-2016-00318]|uniref:NAD-dependent epimerase/dehydratase family protein n=1 Tax=Mycobacterium sp. ITM-2016-00318 TaxID=2099693 RepID=UPI000CF8A625|nr:NAD(P)-dependent oxidoreductase [Mycobacterium sp. ITM-2016-00318]WNG92232.1 NAD(P)-dependent oxidoreductase [Mycobacterium sp. ITM-2016-00318]
MDVRDSVLVTGAYGLVGRPVVDRLVADGIKVTATAHRTVKPALPADVDVRRVDLTESDQVSALVADVAPSAIVHLAAYIPPLCYADRARARAVNVDATAALVRAAQAMTKPPRFVHASSMAVYGSRNPHRHRDLLTPETPPLASELYGCHKLLAENIVRASSLEWSILRLAGVITLEPLVDYGDFDSFYFGSIMPEDNRCHSVDVRDVASAFAAAITTPAIREVLMIAGDDSHKVTHRKMALAGADAIGMGPLMFPGRRGDPDSDTDWFPMDWMDTTRSEEVLSFQRQSYSDSYEEIRARADWKVRRMRMMAPVLARAMRRRAPYYKQPGQYADPYGRIRDRWGDPSPDV